MEEDVQVDESEGGDQQPVELQVKIKSYPIAKEVSFILMTSRKFGLIVSSPLTSVTIIYPMPYLLV